MALFLPFRALGYITDGDVPFAVQRRGKETYVTVSVGKSWQIYNTSNLRLTLIGPQLSHDITALACKGDLTFSAVRGTIVECKRVHRSGQYRGHDADIIQLMVLGDHLFSLGRDHKLVVWRIGEHDAPEAVINLSQDFNPTCMAHPDTYLNKIIVGSDDGRMQLWNFSSESLIHEFASLGSAVRCMTSSPALDVLGIGLADGRAVLHNIRIDQKIMQFDNAAGAGTNADLFLSGSATQAARLAAGGACTSLTFRTGGGVPLMAAGGGAGVVTVWNLEEKKLHCTLRDAHDAPVVRLHFFPGEPVMLSSGADNSLKEWIFDGPDGAPRLLRFRSGHAAPPTVVRHYGDGKRLLSAGQDRAFRVFSTIQDAQSRELSQNHVQKRAKRLKVAEQELKLGRIVSLDACDVRERDWSNVITAHEGDSSAYVWRLHKYALGEHVLSPPPKELLNAPPPAAVTAVALSRCGNFGFVASAAGRLDRYNMQSGLHRGSYSRDGPGGTLQAADGAIYGVASDACNRLVASAGLDGVLRVWNFSKRTLRGEISVGSTVAKMAHHPSTSLVALACDDLTIRMYDIEAMRPVRRFRGHTDRVTDLQLSEDCRWLFSSSMDNTLRVWDVPGARVLQVLRMGSPVTSLSFAPAQDLLATTHVERSGVYLWANQLVFGSGADVVPSEKPINARLPALGTGFHHTKGTGTGTAENGTTKTRVTAMLRHSQRKGSSKAAAAAAAESSDDEESDGAAEDAENATTGGYSSSSSLWGSESDSDEDMNGEEVDGEDAAAAAAAILDPSAGAAYSRKDAAGAPVPLEPELVTLSMLSRTQWLSLVHLDTIKARNKPIEAPTKPQAAPFFLPTLTGADAGRNPVFDLAGGAGSSGVDAATAAAAEAAWGGEDSGSDDNEENSGSEEEDVEEIREKEENAQPAGGVSRVVRGRGGAAAGHATSKIVAMLRSCSDAGDWTSLVAHLRHLPPSEVDLELRSMQLLEESSVEEERDLELLFRFLEAEAISNANFEFVQALLKAVLAVHGDAVTTRPAVRDAAARVSERLAGTWRRVAGTLQHVRCMVGLLGSLQA